MLTTVEKQVRDRVDRLNDEAWEMTNHSPSLARDVAREAFETAEAHDYRYGIARARLNLGWIEYHAADYPAAGEHFQVAGDLFTELDDHGGTAMSLNGMAAIYHRQSDYRNALELYTRSLGIAEQFGLTVRLISALNNIGEVYLELRRLDSAREYLERARDLVLLKQDACADDTEVSHESAVAEILSHLADVYIRTGRLSEAECHLNRALIASRRVKVRPAEANVLSLFGALAATRGETAEAERYQTDSLKVSRSLADAPSRCTALLRLADLHRQLDQYDHAILMYEQALTLARSVSSRYFEHRTLRRMAEVHEELGDYRQALVFLRSSAEIRIDLLSDSADQRFKAMKDRLSADRLRVANDRLQALNEIAQEITSSLDLDDIFARIYETVNRLVDAPVFAVALNSEQSGTIEYRLVIDNGERQEPKEIDVQSTSSFAAYVVRTGEALYLRDVAAEYTQYIEKPESLAQAKTGSAVFVPLSVKGRRLGVLSVQTETINAYSDLDLRIVRTLASFVAIAVDNALIVNRVTLLNRLVRREKDDLEKAYQQISFLAHHDHLTAVGNRRQLQDTLNLELEHMAGNGAILGIIYVDLDRFKPVNDTYGHDAGDAVLKSVAQRIKAVLRREDTVCRFGGDEFVAVVPGLPDRPTAERIADTVAERIGEPIETEWATVQVGASVGVAVAPEDGGSVDDLIKVADRNMYHRKRKGRD